MQRRLSSFVRLRSALLTGAFFATLLTPLTVQAAPPNLSGLKAQIQHIVTPPDARAAFFGSATSTEVAQAHFCEHYDPTADCNDHFNKPYLAVGVVRGGKTVATAAFPLAAVGTSDAAANTKNYHEWVFQSADDPILVIDYHNAANGDDYTEFVLLPNTQTTLTKDVLTKIDNPDPHFRISELGIRPDPSGVLKSSGEDPNFDQKISSWQIPKVSVGEKDDGILGNPLSKAFSAVGGLINDSLSYLITQYKDVIDSLLTTNYLRFLPSIPVGTAQASGPGTSDTAPVIGVWHLTRDLANIFFILILLLVAFGNVLRLEYYTIRALLPRFIAAVVLVNLSLLISQFILDGVGVLTTGIMGDVHFGDIISGGLASSLALGAGATGALFFGPFLLTVLTVAVLTVVALLVARIVVLWFLVATAPLAFTFAILPATRSLYESWWGAFWRFALIAPVMALVLRLAGAFSTTPAPTATGGTLLRTTLIIALLFLAGTVPVMVGGKLMASVQKFLQKKGEGLRGTAYERSTGAQAMAGISQVMENRAEVRGALVSDSLGTLTGDRFGTQGRAVSVERGQAKKLEDNASGIGLTERRRIRTHAGLSSSMRFQLYMNDAQADLLGYDGLLESRRFFSGAQYAKLASEVAQNNLSEIDRDDVQASLIGVRDFLQPKFISDFHDPRYRGDPALRETARYKFARRMNAESIVKLTAGQLRDFTTREKHAVHFFARDLQQIDDRRYHENFINLEAAQAAARIMVDYDYAPAETRGRIVTEAVQTARRIDPTRFGQWSEIQQREIVKAVRSPGLRAAGPEPTPADAVHPEMELDDDED